jgi:hypothetical protein
MENMEKERKEKMLEISEEVEIYKFMLPRT